MIHYFEDFLKKHDVKFYKSYKIKNISALNIGGMADLVAFPDSREKLVEVTSFAYKNNYPYKIIGKMTNILPPDGCYHGILISVKDINRYIILENKISAECGALISTIISKAAKRGLGGLYNLYGIPGTLSGAVAGNAGAYGNSISDFFEIGEFYSPKEDKRFCLSNSEMKFLYRTSLMKQTDFVLLSVILKAYPILPTEEMARMRDVILKRKRSQPYEQKSLGSIFKRSGDVPISKLIDNLGMKGFSVGGAQISEKHAGFIINTGNATASDFIDLANLIKSKVYNRYGITPEFEIEILSGE